MERVKGIEPSSSGWKPDVIAIIQHPLGTIFRSAGNRTQSTCSQSTRTAGIRHSVNISNCPLKKRGQAKKYFEKIIAALQKFLSPWVPATVPFL